MIRFLTFALGQSEAYQVVVSLPIVEHMCARMRERKG